MSEGLLYAVEACVATLTINREPVRNALSGEVVLGFLDRLREAGEDPEVRAVCITNAGDRVFCAGADLVGTLGAQEGEPMAGPRTYARLLKTMAAFPKPLVARVNGHCLAGGLGLMLSCDIVYARKDVYFQTPEVSVGIFPMMVGALLFRDIGRKAAMDMVLTGRKVFAPEAQGIGLVTRAVETDELDPLVQGTLASLAAKSPVGMRIGKEAFRAMGDMPLDNALDSLCEALGRVLRTEDAAEGMLAFLQKRPPVFKGR